MMLGINKSRALNPVVVTFLQGENVVTAQEGVEGREPAEPSLGGVPE